MRAVANGCLIGAVLSWLITSSSGITSVTGSMAMVIIGTGLHGFTEAREARR